MEVGFRHFIEGTPTLDAAAARYITNHIKYFAGPVPEPMFRKTRVRDVPRAKEAFPIIADSQKAGARRPELLALRPALCHRPGVAAQQVVPGARRERPVGPPGGGVEPYWNRKICGVAGTFVGHLGSTREANAPSRPRGVAPSGDRTSARHGPFTVVPASNWSELGSRCRFCRNRFIISLSSGVWASRTPRGSQNGKGGK